MLPLHKSFGSGEGAVALHVGTGTPSSLRLLHHLILRVVKLQMQGNRASCLSIWTYVAVFCDSMLTASNHARSRQAL